MTKTMVDSCVLLDLFTEDPNWFGWSSEAIATAAEGGFLVLNPVIYAEVSVGFQRIEELEALLSEDYFQLHTIPREAAFLAGKCFLEYRRRGGSRNSPLPDFFIGAHAAVEQLPLITRDTARYRTYFPNLRLICPE